jgi:hypothetical protein
MELAKKSGLTAETASSDRPVVSETLILEGQDDREKKPA